MIDSRILFDYFGKISVVNGYEVSEKYIKGLLVILEEQQVCNEELKRMLAIISEMDTYGKPPTLAMYLQARKRVRGNLSDDPESLAAREFEKLINSRAKISKETKRSEMREMGITETTIIILGRLDKEYCCGPAVFLETYANSDMKDRRYIKQDFIDSWTTLYAENLLTQFEENEKKAELGEQKTPTKIREIQ